MQAAEDVDFALRLAFFRDSVDVSIRAGLQAALDIAAGLNPHLDPAAIMRIWMDGNPRAEVGRDYEASRSVSIQGSPQIIWADGSTSHNPGMTDHEWVDGRPQLRSVDALAVERLLLRTMAPAAD
jgi:hypothetical protein